TVRGVAHCIGIPWQGADQNALFNVKLTVHGKRLALDWRSGRPFLSVDTRTWRVSTPSGRGFPWVVTAAGIALVAAALFVLRRLRGDALLRQRVAEQV